MKNQILIKKISFFIFLISLFSLNLSQVSAEQFTVKQSGNEAQCVLNGENVPCEDLPFQPEQFFKFFIIMQIVFAFIFIPLGIFWIIMLIHAIKNQEGDDKLIWILVLILTQFIGAIIYYFIKKRPMDKIRKQKNSEK